MKKKYMLAIIIIISLVSIPILISEIKIDEFHPKGLEVVETSEWLLIKLQENGGHDYIGFNKIGTQRGEIGFSIDKEHVGRNTPILAVKSNNNYWLCPIINVSIEKYGNRIREDYIEIFYSGNITNGKCYRYDDWQETEGNFTIEELKIRCYENLECDIKANITLPQVYNDTGFGFWTRSLNETKFKYAKINNTLYDIFTAQKIKDKDEYNEFYDINNESIGWDWNWYSMLNQYPNATTYHEIAEFGSKVGLLTGVKNLGSSNKIFIDPTLVDTQVQIDVTQNVQQRKIVTNSSDGVHIVYYNGSSGDTYHKSTSDRTTFSTQHNMSGCMLPSLDIHRATDNLYLTCDATGGTWNSTDNGKTWNKVNLSDIGLSTVLKIKDDVLFMASAEIVGLNPEVFFRQSFDFGKTWQGADANISKGDDIEELPVIGVNDTHLLLVWSKLVVPGVDQDIYYSTCEYAIADCATNTNWIAETLAFNTAGISRADSMVVLDNIFHLVMSDEVGGTKENITYSNFTSSWSTRINIVNDAVNVDSYATLSTNGSTLITIWSKATTNASLYSSNSSIYNKTWSTPRNLTTTTKADSYPSVIYNYSENYIDYIWTRDNDGVYEVWYDNINLGAETTPPDITFVNQTPLDIDTFNLYPQNLSITYNITDDGSCGLNASTIRLYYQTNTTAGGCWAWVNGTCILDGYQIFNYTSNINDNYTWELEDYTIYPGTYNINASVMRSFAHSSFRLDGVGEAIKVKIHNVSSIKQYNILNAMVYNFSSDVTPMSVHYCNSSYVDGLLFDFLWFDQEDCTAFHWIREEDEYNYTDGLSSYLTIPFHIDEDGKINDVKVTNTSYFAFKRWIGGDWIIESVKITTRNETTQLTTNAGISWTNYSEYTIDMHLNQYDGNDTSTYYINATDNCGNNNSSDGRSDVIDLVEIPPTAPVVTNPTNETYYSSIGINITYTNSTAMMDASMDYYNISLVNDDFTFNQTIIINNSLNNSYFWINSTIPDGYYRIEVMGCDNNSMCSSGYSLNFTMDTITTYCGGNYTTGNWVIPAAAYINCSNEEIPLNGNLLVQNGGILTFSNITLRVNGSFDGEYAVTVNPGGRFDINISNITNGDTSGAQYRFVASTTTTFKINNSALSEMGWNIANRGLYVETDYANITNSNFTDNFDAIFLDSTAQFNRIENNRFENNSNAAIHLEGGDSNIIAYNTMYNGGYGTLARLTANNNIIENNTIFNIGNVDGIHIFQSNNNLANNNIIYNATFGITVQEGITNNLTNNIIYNTTYGLYLKDITTDLNLWSNNTVYNNTYGVYFTGSNENAILDSNIYNNTNANVYSTGSRNNYVYNSTLSTTITDANNSFLNGTGNITFLNVTFNKSQTGYKSGSIANLYIKWYTWANVTNSSGSPLNNTNVSVFSQYNDRWWTALTNALGITTKTETEEYFENITGRNNYTPLNITATLSGYDDASITDITTTNRGYNITMQETTVRRGGTPGSGTGAGRIPICNKDGICEMGFENIENCPEDCKEPEPLEKISETVEGFIENFGAGFRSFFTPLINFITNNAQFSLILITLLITLGILLFALFSREKKDDDD